jgi:hypothetical protein
MFKSQIQNARTKANVHNSLMSDPLFSEGSIGLKNMATISNKIKEYLKAEQPMKAVDYVKAQKDKIYWQNRKQRGQ